MKTFLVVLMSGVLFQQSAPAYFPVAHGSHASVLLSTVIRVPESSRSALSDLVAIGFENHIPTGITVAHTPDRDPCGTPLNLKPGTMTVADLISVIGATMPGYRAGLQNGVLEVAPIPLSDGTSQFLAMKLPKFQSSPAPHQLLGLTLWGLIQGVLAPGQGTNIVHPMSLSAETVTGMNIKDGTVKSVLDMIVDKGNGGVWILKSSQIKTLSAESPMPYEIYGYVGDSQSLASNMACSK